MKKLLLLVYLIIATGSFAFADTVSVAINHFVVKENPFAQNEVAIVATDSLDNIQSNVSGQFTFTVNGFEEILKFDKGVAFYDHKLDRSSFIYAKHVNDNGTHSNLYYIYKGTDKLTCVHISWIVLLAVPLCLILLGYMFKRFIIIALIIFAIFLYFNQHHGLSIPTFFESIIDGLKSIF